MNVQWSPLALDKVGDIAQYIAQDNPIAAQSWVNNIFDKAEILTHQPEMGRLVSELPDSNCREIIFGHYRIIYQVTEFVEILTVRNCRQEKIFDDD